MPKGRYEIIRKCEVCGKEFLIKTLTSRYCSNKCMNIAYKKRKAEAELNAKLDKVASRIPEARDFIKVSEAYALFGISRYTIYRQIRRGAIKSVNLGKRQIRLSKKELMKIYPLRTKALETRIPKKLYSLEPNDCYTIGEISKKFHLDESTIYHHIRKYSIPTRQIGNYVYVPKDEIDNLYK